MKANNGYVEKNVTLISGAFWGVGGILVLCELPLCPAATIRLPHHAWRH